MAENEADSSPSTGRWRAGSFASRHRKSTLGFGSQAYSIRSCIRLARLTVFSRGCYSQNSSRGSSVVEQPIRNRQVVGSTPTLGSRFF
jgi:hypothetical protein